MPLTFYTTSEARDWLKGKSTVPVPTAKYLSKLCRSGDIRATKVGNEYLILERDLHDYLNSRRGPGRRPK